MTSKLDSYEWRVGASGFLTLPQPSSLIPQPSLLEPKRTAMRVFYVNLVISIALIVGGFVCPPMGVIDGSVLTAVGLLLMFSVLARLPEAIKAGRSVKVTKGDFTTEVGAAEPHT